MRLPMRLSQLATLLALPALACTADLDAPWNYPTAGPGQIALTCDGLPGAAVDATFLWQPTEPTDFEAPLMWSATGLPDGLSIDANTGEVSGEPTTAGAATFDLTVIDNDMAMGTATCMLDVNERFRVDLDVDKVPYCAIMGETLLDFVVDGTGDGSLITCTHNDGDETMGIGSGGGTYGNGDRPDGWQVAPDTCELSGGFVQGERYGTWVFVVQGSQSGVDVFVPYCVTNSPQPAGEMDIRVDVAGMPGVDADLLPYHGTFSADAPFAIGGAGTMDPLFTITDPGVCTPNACYFGYNYGINASPFDVGMGAPPVVVSSMLFDDPMNGMSIGFTHEMQLSGPGAQPIEEFRNRPWVVNLKFDYCLADNEPDCEGDAIVQNANAHLEYSVVMSPQ